MIRVLVDSAADYTKEELAAKKIEMVPLTIAVGDNNYKDELELTRGELYNIMLEGKFHPMTSQPSPQAFAEKFEEIRDAGDEVICIMLSSALSGTAQSAALAKDIVDYDKIYIVDSLSATIGTQLLAEYAQKLIGLGLTAPEIVDKLEAIKDHIRIVAGVDTLKYLYLGGRVSKGTAIVADAVNIKPSIVVTKDGKVGVGGKYLGVSRAVRDLTKQAKAADIDPDFPFCTIFSHDRTNVDKLNKALADAGITVSRTCELGSTLGVHVGPGAFGIIYMAK